MKINKQKKIINSNMCTIGKTYKHGANGGITLFMGVRLVLHPKNIGNGTKYNRCSYKLSSNCTKKDEQIFQYILN